MSGFVMTRGLVLPIEGRVGTKTESMPFRSCMLHVDVMNGM